MARKQMHTDTEGREFSEERESLWRITLSPATWAMHFITSYGAAATICAKAPDFLTWLRMGIAAITLIALALILWFGWRSWRQWGVARTGAYLNPGGTDEDRHEFLGHAAVLLSIISGIGVIYTALPAVILGSCQ